MEITKLNFVPTYSVMNTDNQKVGTILLENLQKDFKGCKGVIVKRQGDELKISACFDLSSDIFKRTISHNLAKLIKAEEVLQLSDEALNNFRGMFVLPNEHVKITQIGKGKGAVAEVHLNALLTLSSLIQIEKGVIKIIGMQDLSKQQFLISIMNFEPKAIQQYKPKKYNNDRNHDNRNNNYRGNNNRNNNYRNDR